MTQKNLPLIQQQLQKAKQLAANGKKDEALAICLKAFKVDPESDLAIPPAIQLYLAQKQGAEALEWLDRLVREYPSAYRLAARLDLMRLEKERPEDLRQAARDALARYPDDANILLSCGAALQACGENSDAVAAYEKRLKLFGDDPGVRNNLGHGRLNMGDMEGALTAWQQILDNPKASPAIKETSRFNMARALVLRGDLELAKKHTDILLEGSPNNLHFQRLRASLTQKGGNASEALREASATLAKDRGDIESWMRVIKLTGKQGELEKAFALLMEASEEARKPLPARKALADAMLARGDETGAITKLEEWHRKDKKESEYSLMLGKLHEMRSHFDEALAWYEEGEKRDPKRGAIALTRFYENREEPQKAKEQAERLLALMPDDAFALGLYAETCYSLQDYDSAIRAVEKGLTIKPEDQGLISQHVNMLLMQERFDEAERYAREACERFDNAKNDIRLLAVLRHAGKKEALVAEAKKLYLANPCDILWINEYAAALVESGRAEDAAVIVEEAYAREPGNLKLQKRLLGIYRELERHEDAVRLAQAMSTGALKNPAEIIAQARTLQELGNMEDGLILLREGMNRYPAEMALWNMAGDFLRRLDRPEEERQHVISMLDRFPPEKILKNGALNLIRIVERLTGRPPDMQGPEMGMIIAKIRQWAARTPNHPDIWWTQLDIAEKLGRHQDSLAALNALERRFPDNPQIYASRANILSRMNKATDSLKYRRKALELRPGSVAYTQALLDEMVKYGDFSEFDALMARIKHLLGHKRYGYYKNLFFNLNCHPTYGPEQIWEYFRDWYDKTVKPTVPAPKPFRHLEHSGKIRVGYISPDFHRHSMAYFMEPIFRGQKEPEFKNNFEVFSYAHLEPGQKDHYTQFFRDHSDHWTDITAMGLDELEHTIRKDGIDILIDMAGHTAHNRLDLFLRRPAPVQAGWIYGYVQTTGLPQLDWMVCDSQEVPPEHESYMAEGRMARFSFGGHPYAPPPDAQEPAPLPCLQRGYVTFGVTTQPRRVNELCTEVWAEILKKAPNAKIRFQREVYPEEEIKKLMLERFARHGIGPERLEFMCVKPLWQAYSDFDCHLDAFPVGYVTTLYEGLWMERPCLSLKARPPMGRVGYGTMQTLGLGDTCAAKDLDDYVKKAVALATDMPLLRTVATGLRQRMKNSLLMDYANFGREIAGLYSEMWRQRPQQQFSN